MKKNENSSKKYALERTERVRSALLKTQAVIALEIEKNGGIYPYHGGRLSQAELCRRAGVSQVTLQNAIHKTTTLPKVNAWLKHVKSSMTLGKSSVRAVVTGRVDHWKSEYEKIATHYHISRLDVADLRQQLNQQELESSEKNLHIQRLETENLALKSELLGKRKMSVVKNTD